MKTIHKYALDENVVTEVETHQGARWLTAQMQGDRMTIWAEVVTDYPKITKRIHVVGTGNVIPENARHYLGTLQRAQFVFHIYAE